jgi:hypothetical protein
MNKTYRFKGILKILDSNKKAVETKQYRKKPSPNDD